jgi:hypothetical protein
MIAFLISSQKLAGPSKKIGLFAATPLGTALVAQPLLALVFAIRR